MPRRKSGVRDIFWVCSPSAHPEAPVIIEPCGSADALGSSPLPPRLMQRLLHRREQVFQHGAAAEVDLRVDLHPRRERVAHTVALQVRRVQGHQRAVAERRDGFTT